MDCQEHIKLECLKIARLLWRNNNQPPYLVAFKDGEASPIPTPQFMHNENLLSRFVEIIALDILEGGEWQAIALFHQPNKGSLVISLILPGKVLTSFADIIDDYGAICLSDFSPWEELDNGITLERCLNRDVSYAVANRLSGCG